MATKRYDANWKPAPIIPSKVINMSFSEADLTAIWLTLRLASTVTLLDRKSVV